MRLRRRMEEELDRDIEEHLALETDENIARGMSPEEARYAALRKFGNIMRVKEDTRSVWGWTSLEMLYADVKHAFRKIGRAPGTACLVVLSLALAFAPSVTMFSVMDRLLLTPLPIRAPDEVAEILFRDTSPLPGYRYQGVSYPEFRDLRGSLKSFSGLAFDQKQPVVVLVNGRRTFVLAHLVSENFWGARRTDPIRARAFAGPAGHRRQPGFLDARVQRCSGRRRPDSPGQRPELHN